MCCVVIILKTHSFWLRPFLFLWLPALQPTPPRQNQFTPQQVFSVPQMSFSFLVLIILCCRRSYSSITTVNYTLILIHHHSKHKRVKKSYASSWCDCLETHAYSECVHIFLLIITVQNLSIHASQGCVPAHIHQILFCSHNDINFLAIVVKYKTLNNRRATYQHHGFNPMCITLHTFTIFFRDRWVIYKRRRETIG